MPHAICSVLECKKRNNNNFRFPQPNDYYGRLSKWLEFANNPQLNALNPNLIYQRKTICALHFKPEDLVPGKISLKKNVIPSLYPHGISENEPKVETADEVVSRIKKIKDIENQKYLAKFNETQKKNRNSQDRIVLFAKTNNYHILNTNLFKTTENIDEKETQEIEIPQEEPKKREINKKIVKCGNALKNLFVEGENINNIEYLFNSNIEDNSNHKNTMESYDLQEKLNNAEVCDLLLLDYNSENIVEEDISYELCRICADLKRKEDLTEIFKTKDITCLNQLNACLPGKIFEDQRYPTKICSDCLTNVNSFYKFQVSFDTANKKLYNIIQNVYGKDDMIAEKSNETVEPMVQDHTEITANPEANTTLVKKKKDPSATEKFKVIKKNVATKHRYQCLKCKLILITKVDAVRHAMNYHKFSGHGRLFFKIVDHKRKLLRSCVSTATIIDWDDSVYQDPDDSTVFNCDLCYCSFSSITELRQHRNAHFFIYKCDECNVTFDNERNLIVHKDRHQISPQVCKCCDKTFENHSALYRHKSMFGSTVCYICGNKYASEKCLKIHLRYVHFSIAEHKCLVCSKKFKSEKFLKNHMVMHGSKKFICELCGKAYGTNALLKQHVKTHIVIKQFKCNICSSSFSNKYCFLKHWRSHERIRSKEKMVCDICKKEFVSQYNFKCHKMSHVKFDEPKKCAHCPKLCMTMRSMHKHLVNVCGVRPYKCTCGKTFRSKGYYEKHKLNPINCIKKPKKKWKKKKKQNIDKNKQFI